MTRFIQTMVALATVVSFGYCFTASAGAYDGSRQAFIDHVKIYAPNAPIPSELKVKEMNGAAIRYGVWHTQQPRQGLVVFLSGRTEFIEKNIPAYTELLTRGFDVYTFDWRGQGLSERVLSHSELGHIDDFETFIADLHVFVQDIVKPETHPGLTLLLGHSMGGHLGLRYMNQYPHVFDRAQFSSPMMGVSANSWASRQFAGFLNWAGWGRSCAPGTEPVWQSYLDENACEGILKGTVSLPEKPNQALLYSNNLNHLAQASCWVEQSLANNPRHHLGLGCPTVGWVKEAFNSMADTMGNLDKVKAPVIIVGASSDKVVTFDAQQQVCDELANCCLWQIQDKPEKPAAHEVLIELDDYAQQFWIAFEALTHGSDAGCACAEIRDHYQHLQCSAL
ncbi:alpha/beta hydrolase [Neiella marina]|uniref:Alpha/beta hydrolase n=1 Tax=Neiella holothuriorum TaxID=2870530 RepID=A0ABS7ECY0_9GAMM|nr:alpha/beta hydrolase [Neiella holothuriorum]MBW8190110.1 alpha/beta hydrolase [Neiella holothuriorum]